jgi:purine-binding chemotaxis protein CheW
MTDPLNTPEDAQQELMAFKAGGQEFCVDIMAIREIRGWTAATPLPKTPSYMKGVINLRGTILPILDLSARLGLGMCEPSGRNVIMVVQIANRSVGLLVDSVSEIIMVSGKDIQPAPSVAMDEIKALITGIIPVGQRLLSLLDVHLVLPEIEAEAA